MCVERLLCALCQGSLSETSPSWVSGEDTIQQGPCVLPAHSSGCYQDLASASGRAGLFQGTCQGAVPKWAHLTCSVPAGGTCGISSDRPHQATPQRKGRPSPAHSRCPAQRVRPPHLSLPLLLAPLSRASLLRLPQLPPSLWPTWWTTGPGNLRRLLAAPPPGETPSQSDELQPIAPLQPSIAHWVTLYQRQL